MDALEGVSLTQDADQHVWKHEAKGSFSLKSSYRTFLTGSITFEPWCRLWKSWAPPKCKTFLWLAIRNKCWTSDRLARRRLPHPEQCVLFNRKKQQNTSHPNHLCVFSSALAHHIILCWAGKSITKIQ